MGIKYKVDEHFFKTWNERMAYTLGYVYADGSLEDSKKIRGKYLRITSVDKESILNMREWLQSEHTIKVEKSDWKNGKLKYMIRIGNSALYNDLLRHGLYPKKSLTIKVPEIPKKWFHDFLRGYFDGDGCVYPYYVDGYARKLSVIFTSGSKEFLLKLSELLHKYYKIKPIHPLDNTRSYQLRYSTNDSLKLYEVLYKKCKKGDYLLRKKLKFEEFIERRNDPVAK